MRSGTRKRRRGGGGDEKGVEKEEGRGGKER